MFSLPTKIVKRLSHYPIPTMVICLILAVLSAIPISNLRWELQLQDTISQRDSQSIDYENIEKSFGGLGSLTIVLKSPDSAYNYKVAKSLAKFMEKDSLVHFLEYETDVSFYKKHSLLYISDEDLDTIEYRLNNVKKHAILKNNPLYVDMDIAKSSDSSVKSATDDSSYIFNLGDLERKYENILARSHANSDGTIRVVDIYPRKPLSDLQAARALLSSVKDHISKFKDVEVYYTGKVYDTIQTGRTLLPEAKFAGKMAAVFILLLFVIHFYRQPELILVSALPAGIPTLFTLALAGILFGRINLFTLLLTLFLPGQSCQIITHVLNRYFIERNNKLGAQLSIESAVLGIGPTTAVSACIMASLFLSLTLVPVTGLRELGILGAIGSIINWGLCILLTTSLLLFFQRKKNFKVNSFNFQHNYSLRLLSYTTTKIFIAAISIVSALGLFYGGYHLKFFYDFDQMEMGHQQNTADSLITQTGFPQFDPIIVKLPNKDAGEDLLEEFNSLRKKGKIPHIDKIYTLAQFSPARQTKKIKRLKHLENFFTDEFLQSLDSTTFRQVSKISESIRKIDFDETDTPDDIRQKFSDNQGRTGIFAYIFSNINPSNGLECRRLNKDLNKFEGIENGTYKISGTPVLRATFLDLILSNLDKALFVGAILICFLLLLYYNRLSRAIFTLLPSLFAMGWLVFLLRVFNIELSAYSSLAFSILFGFSVDGSLQLWTAYYDKQKGIALDILRQKIFSVSISQTAALIGTYALLISSHPGLRSIGQICLLGLICITSAQYIIFPLIAGSLDNYRLRQKKK